MLRFTSPRMGQTVSMPLVLEVAKPTEKDFWLGKNRTPNRIAATLTHKGCRNADGFGRFAPVVQDNGPSTGVRVLLSEDGKKVTIVSRMTPVPHISVQT